MENNKNDLTDFIIKIINNLLVFNEQNIPCYKDENSDLYKTFNSDDYQNSDESTNWWKINNSYNQKAHIIMHLLSKSNLSKRGEIQNKGFIYLIKYIVAGENEKSKVTLGNKETLNLLKFLKNNKSNMEGLENCGINQEGITTLIDYLELYFSCGSNFKGDDYSKYNIPILNNLYKWYLQGLDNKQKKRCCEKLGEIVKILEGNLNSLSKNATNMKKNYEKTIEEVNNLINKLVKDK